MRLEEVMERIEMYYGSNDYCCYSVPLLSGRTYFNILVGIFSLAFAAGFIGTFALMCFG
jgi:hypothetical protein